MAIGTLAFTLICAQGLGGPAAAQKSATRYVNTQISAQVTPRLTLGRPVQIGNLGLVPIDSDIPIARDKYLTLAEATKMGVIEIIEAPDQNNFSILQVRNLADLPILLFSGELLLGGKQDRIVARDSIIPPRERRDVPVYCVEHGRWEGGPKFHYGDMIVPEKVRAAAQVARSQSGVWNNVAESNAKVAAAPATGTLRGTLDNPAIRAEANRLVREMKAQFRPGPHTVGVMCVIGGRIESADIFANAAMFNASRDELFRSYAVDAQMVGRKSTGPVNLPACRGFLTDIVRGTRQNDEAGRVRLSTRTVNGVEFGAKSFSGGFGGGGRAGEAGNFSHGTYRPNNGGN